MKRIGIVVAAICLILVVLVGCAPQPAQPGIIKARFSGWAPPPSIPGMVETHLFELIHEKVGDKIEIEVFQNGTLYKYQEAQIPLKTGAIEIIDYGTVELYEWAPEFKVTFLSGAWDADELLTYLESPEFAPAWDEILKVGNCIPLCLAPAGTFYMWSTEPVSSTVDFKDLRVESGNFEQIDIVKALGGSGGALQVFDIYTALQQGMYDAAMGTPSIVLGFGWGEFLKYLGTHGWTVNYNVFLINKDFWDSLPADVQAAFKEAAAETTEWAVDYFPTAEAAQIDALVKEWNMERFTIEDWDNVVKTAEEKVWPTIEEEVGTDFFNNAMKYAGLEY
jgi:TRAP-type C4-dicarboxylate transport system substrate-binding protein